MQSDQLEVILRHDRATSSHFVGVFAANRIPREPIKKPYCYIVNNQPDTKRGQHWLAVFVSDEKEFFDPLNLKPEDYGLNIKVNETNSAPIQPYESDACGLHVMYYLMQRCRGFSMSDITTNMYQENVYYNDCMVFIYFYDLVFNKYTKMYDVSFIYSLFYYNMHSTVVF